MIDPKALFKWQHFLPDIILNVPNARWYCRHSLSYRDLEEMMAERGVEVDHIANIPPAPQDLNSNLSTPRKTS